MFELSGARASCTCEPHLTGPWGDSEGTNITFDGQGNVCF